MMFNLWRGLQPLNPWRHHVVRSKYQPHQGAREKLRRLRQANPRWIES